MLIPTRLFQSVRLKIPFVHGQRVLDTWIGSLVMGVCKLGLVYPLPQQHRGFARGTLIQNAQAVAATGSMERLKDITTALGDADLIPMHSVGFVTASASGERSPLSECPTG